MMWARILPDDLGRPTRIQFNKLALRTIGPDPYRWEIAVGGDRILLFPDPDGRVTRKVMAVPHLLDRLNALRTLSDVTFPVRRVRNKEHAFELWVYEYDPALRASSYRANAGVMRVEMAKRAKYVLTARQVVRAFALLSVIWQRPLELDDLTGSDPLRLALPGVAELEARFGSLVNLRDYANFRSARMRPHLSVDAAKLELAGLIDRQEGGA